MPTAMDSGLAQFTTDMPMSTTPQQAFKQADDLLQQAAALRQQADDLRDHIGFLNERADTLTTTAEGLQELGAQDYE